MKKTRAENFKIYLLLFSAFVIASCGLTYELIAGTVSSYLLGDSVTQFSRTIGVYLFAMGVGSYLSKFIIKETIEKFIDLELAVALIGGFSAPLLFFAFSFGERYGVILYLLLMIIGTLVGIEIPLLLRILKQELNFRELISRVLSLDYIGGLIAALAFPLMLVRPEVGLIRTSLLFGVFNTFVAFLTIYIFREKLPYRKFLIKSILIISMLIAGLLFSRPLQNILDAELYADPVIFSEQTPYQKIIMTKWKDHVSVFLNNNLQFSTWDEYRYHESLVHPLVQALLDRDKKAPTSKSKYHVLVLGGGDGLAIRELLRYEEVETIHLVDIDPGMTKVSSENYYLSKFNEKSLTNQRVKIFHQDAFLHIKDSREKYDAVIIDFPDPGNFSLGKLYSDVFFQRLKRIMKPNAIGVTQATSPFIARKAFWCIETTIHVAGFNTFPYHAYVPSFGEWGFIIFTRGSYTLPQKFREQKKFRFLNAEILPQMFQFPADMSKVRVDPQKLNSQALVHYYESEWNYAVH